MARVRVQHQNTKRKISAHTHVTSIDILTKCEPEENGAGLLGAAETTKCLLEFGSLVRMRILIRVLAARLGPCRDSHDEADRTLGVGQLAYQRHTWYARDEEADSSPGSREDEPDAYFLQRARETSTLVVLLVHNRNKE